jgi:hypothetical protein
MYTPDGYAPVYYDQAIGRVLLTRRFSTEAAARLFIGRCLEEPIEQDVVKSG